MVITIGSYIPGNSYLHRFDSRLKLLLLLFITVTVLLIYSPIAYVVMLFALVAGAVAAGIKIRLFVAQLRFWGWLFILTVVLHLLFTEGTTSINVLGLSISLEGSETRQ